MRNDLFAYFNMHVMQPLKLVDRHENAEKLSLTTLTIQ